MAVLMPEGKQSFSNSAGVPIIGGKLYTYDAGTNTPRPTYQDAAGVVPNTNPIILDARGEATAFWSGAYKVVLKDASDVTIWTVDNVVSTDMFAATLAGPTGASLIGFTPAGAGAVTTTLQEKCRERVSVLGFGADKTGAIDATAAFNLAKTYLGGLGGGIAHVPYGTYKLTNFDLDQNNVIFEGETNAYGYETHTNSVLLTAGVGAVYVARLKGTRSGVVGNAAGSSGFKGLQFYGVGGAVEYGLFIDSGATILEDVDIQGFQYGCVMADGINSNRFKNCGFVLNTKVGVGICEFAANSYINPNVTGITSISNTSWSMEGCNIRQNGFGLVIRSTVNATIKDCTIESNDQAGIYIYRPDSSTVRQLNFINCWCENNYQAYTSGSTTFSVVGNRFFLITNAATYIAWTSLLQAGYQMVIDSQTHYGGGGDTFEFNECAFNCNGVQQKAILILAGFKFNFRKPWFANGDTANLIRVTTDAEAVHWYDPLAGNDPVALVASLTNAFGANVGNRGAYFKSGTSFGVAELGGVYPEVGVFGGPIHFRAPVVGDPRRADVRCLDDYFEGDNTFAVPWRVGAALPFTVNTQTTSVTKIGRQVHVEMVATLTANAVTAATDKLYSGASMPYAAAALGNLVGRAWVQPTGGGASVLNGGVCDMWMDTTASLYGVVDVFPILAIGHTYTIKVSATYTAAT